jgi:hypothetical protein
MRKLCLLAGMLILSLQARAGTVDVLAKLAPKLRPEAIQQAVAAMKCAQDNGVGRDARTLAIIDYTLPSRVPRMWVFNLGQPALLYEEHVAHGKNSGEDVPVAFSDRDDSKQTSLGLFLTDTTYQGGNGYSLRLHGLSRGFNEAALRRLIVMHGAAYVNPAATAGMGRLGRSWGCPVVRREVARPMIDALKEGNFIYAYGPGTARLAQCRDEDLALHAARKPVTPPHP